MSKDSQSFLLSSSKRIEDLLGGSSPYLASEATLISLLNTVKATQDVEILLIRDTGASDVVVQQIREYTQPSGPWVTSYEDVGGNPYNPVGPLVYLDPSAVLNILLTETTAQGLTLDSQDATLTALIAKVTADPSTASLQTSGNTVLSNILTKVTSTDTATTKVDTDNVTVTNGAGASGINIQDGGNSITVDGTVVADAGTGVFTTDGSATTQPISAASLPLPSGAALSANQLADGHNVTIDNGSGANAVNIKDGGNSITVDGTVGISGTILVDGTATTQPVSLATIPIPTGAATSANQLPNGHTVIVGNNIGGAAVSIQDGGNSITVDGVLTDAELRAAPLDVSLSGTLATTGPLTDTELRATSVAVYSASAATEATLLTIDSDTGGILNNAVNISANSNNIKASTASIQATNTSIDANILTTSQDTTSIDNKTPALGQSVKTSSVPVTLASDQGTLNVAVTASPLPTGAATAALQGTMETSLDAIQSNTAGLENVNAKITACDTGAVVLAAGSATIGTVTANLSATDNAVLDAMATDLAAIEITQGTIAGDTTSIDGKITACNTGAVVVSSSALPTGAATESSLNTINTSLTNINNNQTTINSNVAIVAGDTTSLDSKVTACNTGAVVLAAGSANIGAVALATPTNTYSITTSDLSSTGAGNVPTGARSIEIAALSTYTVGDITIGGVNLPPAPYVFKIEADVNGSLAILNYVVTTGSVAFMTVIR